MGGRCNGDSCEIPQEDEIDYNTVARVKLDRWARSLGMVAPTAEGFPRVKTEAEGRKEADR